MKNLWICVVLIALSGVMVTPSLMGNEKKSGATQSTQTKKEDGNKNVKPKLAAKEKVVFTEDFDSAKASIDPANPNKKIPNTKIWRLCDHFMVAWAQHFPKPGDYQNVEIADGFLKVKASKVDGKYITGGVRTIKGFKNNTRVEVRAKMTHKAKGMFPAIWQMPLNGKTWPESGEIDIMEWVQDAPNQIYQTIHTAYTQKKNKSGGGHTNAKPDKNFDVTQFHIYAAERTTDKLTFFVNGKETFVVERDKNLDPSEGQFPFADLDFDIILNCSLGGMLYDKMTWPGKIDDSALPVEMWVDWVRVVDVSANVPKASKTSSKEVKKK